MSLYPTISLDPVTAGLANNCLPSGTLIMIPIDLTSVQMTQITIVQLSLTQDYSIRMWLSVYADGIALAPGLFPILRGGGLPFIICLASQTPPANTYPIVVAAGSYILNILNLTNEQNVFSFNKTDLA